MNRLLAPVVGAPIIALGLIVFAVVGSLPSYAQNSGGQPQSAATPAPASAPAAQDSGSANTAKPDAASGARIAESGTEVGAAACASCHNPDGSGNPDTQAPRLAGQVAAYLHKQLDDYASGARKNDIMAPIAQALSDADKANVAAHYAETRAPYPPLGQTDPQKVRAGQVLAMVGSEERRVQACDNCHGPRGTGLPPVYPYLAGQYDWYIKAQYEAWRQGDRANDPQSVMRTIFSLLEEQDVDAVAAYFASVRPAEEGVGGGSSTSPQSTGKRAP